MNDYEMTILAADRRRQLQGEAERHRLSRGSHRQRAARHGLWPLRRPLETTFDILQRRAPASRPR